jgi:hypothetical protein
MTAPNILQYQLVDGGILLVPDNVPTRTCRPGNPIRIGGQAEQWCEQNLRFLREVQDAADQLRAEEMAEQARIMSEVDKYVRTAREQGRDQGRREVLDAPMTDRDGKLLPQPTP